MKQEECNVFFHISKELVHENSHKISSNKESRSHECMIAFIQKGYTEFPWIEDRRGQKELDVFLLSDNDHKSTSQEFPSRKKQKIRGA